MRPKLAEVKDLSGAACITACLNKGAGKRRA
jgi:hypothetical protein